MFVQNFVESFHDDVYHVPRLGIWVLWFQNGQSVEQL